MSLFRRATPGARQELRDARADLNGRFNNGDTSPDDPAYLAANQRVINAEKNARNSRRG